jgi:hypothetical protein
MCNFRKLCDITICVCDRYLMKNAKNHYHCMTCNVIKYLCRNKKTLERKTKTVLQSAKKQKNAFLSLQSCGSVTFCYGSGSTDPCLWLMDPDPDQVPAIFVIHLQRRKSFSAYYFLKVHIHHFLKIKVIKKLQKSRNQSFTFFCLMIEGSGFRIQVSD